MRASLGQSLLALVVLIVVLVGNRPIVLATQPGAPQAATTGVAASLIGTMGQVAATPIVALPAAPGAAASGIAPVAPADSPLRPCAVAAHRAACAAAAAELAAYGLDIADAAQWTAFGLERFVEATEHLADAFGGGGERARRIERLGGALQTGPGGLRVKVLWQATPQERGGNPVRGGYGANTLFFNPNTFFLDRDSADEVVGRDGERFWWNFVHEMAHLWDERSAPVAVNRQSARMLSWVRAQVADGGTDEYPSSYAVTGGPLEAFADSVAATVTGDAANRDYYGSLRDHFVRAALCEASNCQP